VDLLGEEVSFLLGLSLRGLFLGLLLGLSLLWDLWGLSFRGELFRGLRRGLRLRLSRLELRSLRGLFLAGLSRLGDRRGEERRGLL